LRIAIAGLTGCGKTSVGRLVAEKLGYKTIEFTFKELAKESKIELMKFHEMARKDPKHAIDRELDAHIREEAGRGNCVIATWLAPWVVGESELKVWLDASEETRAKRIAGREGIPLEEALLHVKKRDKENIERYKEVYGIDITNHRIFDLIINTDNSEMEKTAEIICIAARKKEREKR